MWFQIWIIKYFSVKVFLFVLELQLKRTSVGFCGVFFVCLGVLVFLTVWFVCSVHTGCLLLLGDTCLGLPSFTMVDSTFENDSY